MGIPLRIRDRIIGLLNLNKREEAFYSPEDAALVMSFANQAAVSIENARLFRKTEEHNRQLTTLYNISEYMHKNPLSTQAFMEIAGEIGLSTAFSFVAIGLYDTSQKILNYQGVFGFMPLAETAWSVPVKETASASVIKTGQLFFEKHLGIVEHIYSNDIICRLKIGTLLCFPLKANNKIIGTITLADEKSVHPGNDMLHWGERLADYLAALIERQQIEEAMLRTQKLESLGVMAGGIAHDFNNLLTGILSESEAALYKIPETMTARENVFRVIQAANRAADLTRQMLAYTGKGHFHKVSLNLNTLITENLNFLHSQLSTHNQPDLNLAKELPDIEADPGQLQQVVMNLILNAIEAYNDETGEIRICTSIEHMDSSVEDAFGQSFEDGDYICLRVQDWAGGIAPETLSQIFDPFFTTKFTGRGLGLAAVQGIIRGHKGFIQAVSQVGIGSIFRVYLPVGKEGISAEEVVSMPLLRGEGTVLIIDDEPVVRHAMGDVLKMFGYDVITAENGQIGLELVAAYKDDLTLILLDIMMPVMSGYDTLIALRELNPSVPVILLSGYGKEEVGRRLKDIQFIHFLQKPVKISTLITKISQIDILREV
jgi:signal transduction histidine kinase/CheY-like chemotaxis protein